MTPSQIARISRALEKVWNVIAGDFLIYVDPDGGEHELLTIEYDLWNEQGLVIDAEGLRNLGIRELIFLKPYLLAQNVEIKITGYFLIEGERWDFAKKEVLQEKVVPIAGIHDLVIARVRRASEVNNTEQPAEWGWGE